MGAYKLDLIINGLPKMFNVYKGMHWSMYKKEKDAWLKLVRLHLWQAGGAPPEPLKKARLKLTRCSSKECDFDGLVHSFKPIIDALKNCGVIEDDRMSVIGQPSYFWAKSVRKQGYIMISVEG